MISKDDIAKIQALKAKRYSQAKVAKELNISRSSIQRYWGPKRLTFDVLFLVSPCKECKTIYPHPKFLPQWKCPFCKKDFEWVNPWFTPASN